MNLIARLRLRNSFSVTLRHWLKTVRESSKFLNNTAKLFLKFIKVAKLRITFRQLIAQIFVRYKVRTFKTINKRLEWTKAMS